LKLLMKTVEKNKNEHCRTGSMGGLNRRQRLRTAAQSV
jgi:hypothetical protein